MIFKNINQQCIYINLTQGSQSGNTISLYAGRRCPQGVGVYKFEIAPARPGDLHFQDLLMKYVAVLLPLCPIV